MLNGKMRTAAVLALVILIFSALSAYLILDRINLQGRLNSQEQQISVLQNAVEQLSNQNEALKQLQDTIEQLEAQYEQINEIHEALEQLNEQKAQIIQLQESLAQMDLQQTQIAELQNKLNETRSELSTIEISLSDMATQIGALNQSTSEGLAEIQTAIETVEGLISELSALEETINQLAERSPADIYESSYRSVVLIRTPSGQGSGFLYNTSNIVVTNYHVVDEETDIEIEFFDRTRTQATVIGSDPYSDIAVLSIPSAPPECNPLKFGNQSSIGQQVVAIGNPLGLTESLSVGYISQVNRLLDLEPIIVPVLQLDLTIAPGSSGGPLLDMKGNVVGITNAGTDVGFNFAVPVNIANRVVSR